MDAEYLELSNMAGENAKWTSHFAKQSSTFLYIKLYIYLPCDPAIVLLGVYLSELKTDVHTERQTGMIIVVLFTTAKS